jgi:hypothetical protein
MSFSRIVFVGMVVATLVTVRNGEGQFAPRQMSEFQTTSKDADHRAEVERANALNADHKKHLISDADKLIQLSTVLKKQINETGTGGLSAAAIKNASEIERLAQDVKKGLAQSPYRPSWP